MFDSQIPRKAARSRPARSAQGLVLYIFRPPVLFPLALAFTGSLRQIVFPHPFREGARF